MNNRNGSGAFVLKGERQEMDLEWTGERTMTSHSDSTAEIVDKIRRDFVFLAPEIRVRRLLRYLDAYGEPLYRALLTLPTDERDAIGIDQVRQERR